MEPNDPAPVSPTSPQSPTTPNKEDTTNSVSATASTYNNMPATTDPFVGPTSPSPALRSSLEDVTLALHEHHLSFSVQELTVDLLAHMVKTHQIKLLANLGGTRLLAGRLDCKDIVQGLPEDFDFENRRKEFGYNEIEKQKVPSYLSLIWDGLQDVIMLMLIAAAIVSLILGLAFEQDKSIAWIEGAAILLVVAIVLNVQAMTDYSKTATFRQQQLELEDGKRVIVVRGGKVFFKEGEWPTLPG